MQLTLLTAITMLAFAANSVLCRMALGGEIIDAANFTAIRLTSGALMLLFSVHRLHGNADRIGRVGIWLGLCALVLCGE